MINQRSVSEKWQPTTEDKQDDANFNLSGGVPSEYSKQTASNEMFNIQKGNLNKLRLRPQILNEHAESSREVQSIVTSTNIVGQIFKASQDNINGINLAMESAGGLDFDDFESYADSAALQAVWTATGDLATLDETIVYDGDKSMRLPADDNVDDEWARTFVSTDFTGYVGQFYMYSNKEYKDVKMRVFVEDSSGNTSSTEIITVDKEDWYKYVFPVASLVADSVTPADLTDIIKIGFRVEKEKGGGYAIFDDLVSVPGPGTVKLKLWDMGEVLPVSGTTSIDDGTQYEKIGDLGITGRQVAELEVNLVGGFRVYQINKFIAGTSKEIPTNELLNPNHHYAITINYVDTNVSMYGPATSFAIDYYKNGYAFTAPDEATAITKIGTYSDLMFTIYSTQDVYVNKLNQIANAVPNGDSSFNVYVEDSDMKREDTIISRAKGRQIIDLDLSARAPFLEKGGKIEEEYNDDFTDDVSSIDLGFRYFYIPPTING